MKWPILAYLDVASGVLPVSAGVYRQKLVRTKAERVRLFCFVLAGFVVDLLTFILARQHINNLWIVAAYELVEFELLISVLYAWELRPAYRRAFRIALFTFPVLWLLAKVTGLEPLGELSTYTHTLSMVCLLLGAATMLSQLARGESWGYWKDIRFWTITAILFYYSGNLTLFLLGDKVLGLHIDDLLAVWQVHWSIDIATNALMALGFLSLRQ